MTKRKAETFVQTIQNWLKLKGNDEVKLYAGNSTVNNRTPTINQVTRALLKSNETELASDIASTRQILIKSRFLKNVRKNKNRTDAYDINEFFYAVKKFTANKKRNAVLGRLISNYNTNQYVN